MSLRPFFAGAAGLMAACAAFAAGCGSPQKMPEALAVALPDVSGMEASARRQIETQFSSLKATIGNRSSTSDDVATAYGDMGKLLMAGTFLDAAEVCFLNAQSLAPDDRRWPYYLGHLYKGQGPIEKSVTSFERAQQLAPDDVSTMVWLGDAYLAAGRTDAADQLFAKALAREPSLAAARSGAGRAALAKREYRQAVDQFTQALGLDPRATSIHYQLAMAYRGLGDLAQSEVHLAQQGEVDPRPVDPLMREIDGLLESPEAYNLRGGAELEAGHWDRAAAQFRKGLELNPNEPSLRHRLGTALYQMGETQHAVEQFEQVLRTTPDYARAHFSLGVLLRDAGKHPEAIERFSAALKYEPRYVEARVQLAGVLARTGHPGEAVAQYAQALESEPTHADAAFGRGMAFARLRRYAEARDAFDAGMKSHPDQAMFAHALARLLAAAPDDRVRDGRGALKLIDELIKGQQTIELAETTAMALAESGRYPEAVAVQRDALTAAGDARLPTVQRRIAGNLRLYENRKPCRTPFADDEWP